MGHFGGYVWLFWGCGGGPAGPGWGNYPSQMWMSYYVKEKCGWCGDLWLHDITLVALKHDRENGSFLGVCLAVLGL